MYSILNRKGVNHQNIVQFLAEEDKDLFHITDRCDPGSTVEVLEKDNIHTWIKAPSDHWVIYEGKVNGDFTAPINDAELTVPVAEAPAFGGEGESTKKISDYQKNIGINKSGLVTGELYEQEHSQFGDDNKGHFLMFSVEVPEGATNYQLSSSDGTNKTVQTDDTDLIIKTDKYIKDGKTCKIKFDSGESFELCFDDLDLL